VIRTDIQYVDRIPVARPRGDVDAASARFVHEDLSDRLGPDADVLVVDLSATRYVDSAGVDMLFRLDDRLRQRRAALRLVVPTDSPLQRLLEIVGLRASVAVFDCLDDAIGANGNGVARLGPDRPE
jgi:anti-anti-sigma factor